MLCNNWLIHSCVALIVCPVIFIQMVSAVIITSIRTLSALKPTITKVLLCTPTFLWKFLHASKTCPTVYSLKVMFPSYCVVRNSIFLYCNQVLAWIWQFGALNVICVVFCIIVECILRLFQTAKFSKQYCGHDLSVITGNCGPDYNLHLSHPSLWWSSMLLLAATVHPCPLLFCPQKSPALLVSLWLNYLYNELGDVSAIVLLNDNPWDCGLFNYMKQSVKQ